MTLNFPSLAVVVAAVVAVFSLTSQATTEAATPPAGNGDTAAAATPKTDAKPAKKGKTRGLKSKKKKECSGRDYCE